MKTVELGKGIAGNEGLGMADVVGFANQHLHKRHREQRKDHTPG